MIAGVNVDNICKNLLFSYNFNQPEQQFKLFRSGDSGKVHLFHRRKFWVNALFNEDVLTVMN
ncbi:hypothetical protein BH11BAC5_BH11BAC5_27380 [soil metagenome]